VATALIILLIKSADDLLWVPVIETIGAVIALALSWENAVRAYHIVPVAVTLQKVLQVIRDSTTFFVATAATTIFSSLTTLFIGYFITDDAEISYWSIAMSAVGAVQALFSPIVNSLYPHMVHERDFKLLKFLLVLGVPVDIIGTIAFALLSNVIMLILGGEQYMDGAYVIALVAPMLLFSYPAVLLGYPVLAAVGWVKELTVTSVVSAVFHIVGLFVLAASGTFTLESVCVLRCCTEFVLMAGRIYYVLKYLRTQQVSV
jgi:PST family polysaccharide transporter